MSNPFRILQPFDRHLVSPAEMTLFGRAALALGFAAAPPDFHHTRNVDAILSAEWLSSPDENIEFWLAQQRTNAELSRDGLYLTHLLRDSEVIILPDWPTRRVQLPLQFPRLTIYRPATVDWVLTTRARADEQDLKDIHFLLRQEPISPRKLQAAFEHARVPNVTGIRQLFAAAQPKVLQHASNLWP